MKLAYQKNQLPILIMYVYNFVTLSQISQLALFSSIVLLFPLSQP
jgi:hypothetical protein